MLDCEVCFLHRFLCDRGRTTDWRPGSVSADNVREALQSPSRCTAYKALLRACFERQGFTETGQVGIRFSTHKQHHYVDVLHYRGLREIDNVGIRVAQAAHVADEIDDNGSLEQHLLSRRRDHSGFRGGSSLTLAPASSNIATARDNSARLALRKERPFTRSAKWSTTGSKASRGGNRKPSGARTARERARRCWQGTSSIAVPPASLPSCQRR